MTVIVYAGVTLCHIYILLYALGVVIVWSRTPVGETSKIYVGFKTMFAFTVVTAFWVSQFMQQQGMV